MNITLIYIKSNLTWEQKIKIGNVDSLQKCFNKLAKFYAMVCFCIHATDSYSGTT